MSLVHCEPVFFFKQTVMVRSCWIRRKSALGPTWPHSGTSLPRTGELVDLAHPGPGGNGKCDLADHLERAEETVSEATRIYIYIYMYYTIITIIIMIIIVRNKHTHTHTHFFKYIYIYKLLLDCCEILTTGMNEIAILNQKLIYQWKMVETTGLSPVRQCIDRGLPWNDENMCRRIVPSGNLT